MNVPTKNRIARMGLSAVLGGILVLGLGSCAALDPGNQQQLIRDIMNLENKVDALADQQTETEHKIIAQLGTMDSNQDRRGGVTLNAVEDMEQRMLDLENAINALRGEVQELSGELRSRDRISSTREQLTPSSTEPASTPDTGSAISGAIDPPASGTGSTPDQPAQSPPSGDIETLLTDAQHQLNLGNVDRTLEILAQAGQQSPSQSQEIEIEYWTGEAHYASEDLNEAYNHYYDVINIDRQSPRAWNSLERMAEIRLKQGQREQAQRLLDIFNGNPSYERMDQIERLRREAGAQ